MAESSETDGIVLRYYEKIRDEQGSELARFRMLWDEIFHDPAEFAEYYFRDVCVNNKILGAYIGEELVGMIHLNPYNIYTDTGITDSYYIVGVAVKERLRRRGIMRLMMERVIEDMQKWGCLFAFLMPKRREYYTCFGFRTIYETCVMKFEICEDGCAEVFGYNKQMYSEMQQDILDISELSGKEMEILAGYINQKLSEQYSFFSERSERYLRNMLEEHQCQHGGVAIIGEKQCLCLFSYDNYDDTMYVERFELLVHPLSDEKLIYVIAQILAFAGKKQCKSCNLTVPLFVAEMMKKVRKSDAWTRKLICNPGYGIMALSLARETFPVDKMKNISFFDEIV